MSEPESGEILGGTRYGVEPPPPTAPTLFSDYPSNDLPPAVGVGPRLAARLIDLALHYAVAFSAGILVAVVLVFGTMVGGGDVQALSARLQEREGASLWTFVLAILGSVAFHTFAEGLHGSTIGKRLIGLTVLHEEGGEPTLGGAFKRSLAFYWDTFFFCAPALVSMNHSSKEQRVGDKWGKTMVVRLRDVPAVNRPSAARFVGANALALGFDGVIMGAIALLPLF